MLKDLGQPSEKALRRWLSETLELNVPWNVVSAVGCLGILLMLAAIPIIWAVLSDHRRWPLLAVPLLGFVLFNRDPHRKTTVRPTAGQ